LYPQFSAEHAVEPANGLGLHSGHDVRVTVEGDSNAGVAQVAAVQRSILALGLPMTMAVHQRVLYDSENRPWRLVAEAAGERWATVQADALGLSGPHRANEAALRLYQLAADTVRDLLSVDQQTVVDFALAKARAEASDG
jgi:hypothetical protein